MTCSSGPPWLPGNTDLSIALRVLCLAQDQPAARAAQRLVRRRRDDVGVRHRRRIHAAGDESGEVRHVHHEESRRSRCAMSANAAKSIDARVGAVAGEHELRAMLARLASQVVVVDAALRP